MTATPDEWDSDLYQAISASLVVLPQQTSTPIGWQSFIRAPLGWEQDEFSSFVQWVAPSDGPFSGTEIWFQVGSRGELVGQGEAGFVLRSLGVNYVSQVDESQSYPAVLGGLPASAQPFESFTHTGIAYNAIGGTDFGTANLVARAPLGQWTAAHQQLVEAMVASVQIIPPSADSAPVGLAQGYRPPNFTGRYLDGTSFGLDQYQGQLVLLHFWFVDCPSCRAEWPHLNAIYQEFKDQGLVLLAVNAIDSLEYIQAYMESEGLDFPIIQDNGQIHQLYNVALFPTTYVITPDGVINQAARGPLSERSLRNLMERYLGG
jgi:peroxiredoxin